MNLEEGDCIKMRDKWFTIKDIRQQLDCKFIFYVGEFETDYITLPKDRFKIEAKVSMNHGLNAYKLVTLTESEIEVEYYER